MHKNSAEALTEEPFSFYIGKNGELEQCRKERAAIGTLRTGRIMVNHIKDGSLTDRSVVLNRYDGNCRAKMEHAF